MKAWEASATGTITRPAALRSATQLAQQLQAWRQSAVSPSAALHVDFLLDRLAKLQQ